MKRHQPDEQTGTPPEGNPTGAARFALAQPSNHRGGHASTDITRNRSQGFLTEHPTSIISEGALIGVAWDKVTDYLVFDSAKDYWKRLKICHRRKGEG